VVPALNGSAMTENAFEMWRSRAWTAALKAAGTPYQRPYDLRHGFASLLLHEGRSVIYVARQLGHGAQLTMSTYGHVIDELEDAPPIAAEDAIMAARRAEEVRTEFGHGS
jgi:integrase